jgi:MYXO-CTERM domain-containing protein
MVFDADEWDSTISFAPDIPVTLGGTLELTFAGDVDLASQVGRSLDLFDWAGVEPSGLFNIAGPHIWDLSNLYTTGDVTLAAVGPLPGDYNGNGIVDAADSVVWRASVGSATLLNRSPHLAGPVGPSDYAFWKANFGRSLGSAATGAASAVSAIPEPGAFVLVALGLFGLIIRRRQPTPRTNPGSKSDEESHAEAQRRRGNRIGCSPQRPQRLCVSSFILVVFTGADLRGAVFTVPVLGATTTNVNWPNGRIDGLDLDAASRLVVRDYDYFGNAIPSPVIVDQHLTIAPGGTLQMVFEADAWDSTISFSPGIPVTLGGTLELTFAADVNLANQIGRTLKIFDWTGVQPTAFAIASPYTWNLSNLYTTGEVTLTAIPEPASFVVTTALAAHLVLRRHCRLRCAPSKSRICLPSPRKELDPLVTFFGRQAVSGDQQFIDGLANRHVGADDKHAGHREACSDAGVGERRNRPAIVGQQNSAVEGRPFKHPGIGRSCQVHFANVNKVKRQCASSHSVHDVFIEVLINEKGDHGINPFAWARAKSSFLVGPVGCDASIVLRMASLCSSHWRRYSSNGSGLARYRLITAYTSAKRSERNDRAIPSGDSPCLKARITNSSSIRLSPTRNTPGGSSDNGTFRHNGSKSTVLTVPILPSSLCTQPPLDVLADKPFQEIWLVGLQKATQRLRKYVVAARIPAAFDQCVDGLVQPVGDRCFDGLHRVGPTRNIAAPHSPHFSQPTAGEPTARWLRPMANSAVARVGSTLRRGTKLS